MTRSINLSGYKKYLWFYIKLNTKVKNNFLENGYTDTSVVAIWNGFIEVLWINKKTTLAGFNEDLSKKSILIGTAVTYSNLQNVNIIYQINETLIIHGGSN